MYACNKTHYNNEFLKKLQIMFFKMKVEQLFAFKFFQTPDTRCVHPYLFAPQLRLSPQCTFSVQTLTI